MITWSFINTLMHPDIFTDYLYFHVLELLSQESTPDYLAWWGRNLPGGGGGDRFMGPELDLDNDGISNYTEYLMDMNPWIYSPVLGLVRGQGINQLDLWHNRIPLELSDNVFIEYATSPVGLWKEATSLLGNSKQDLLHPNRQLKPIENIPGDGRLLFFRMRIDEETPSLDSLIGDN